MNRVLLSLAAVAAIFGSPIAADDRESARNVVQIRCILPKGEMKATGFVWPDPGYVVTALHAVAGCREVVVYSEAKRDETVATGIERAFLEADLALLRLADDMGLKPVPFAKGQPDTRADHFVWGYPHTAEEMIDQPIDFAGGLKGVTTLGQAFASKDLNELFAKQKYPARSTQILRVTSTIQPGHSGAPIFDKAGRVAAIADGGLLGGWKGINWSIPAHIYLPELVTSKDPVPKSTSTWSGLYSSVTTKSARAVAVKTSTTGGPKTTMQHVRRVPIAVIERDLKANAPAFYQDLRYVREVLGSTAFGKLGFDIYEERTTGATIGVPLGVSLKWDPRLNAIVAEDDRGDIVLRMTTAVHRATSHGAAKRFGIRTFAKTIASVARFEDSVDDIRYESDGPGYAWFEGFTEGTDRATGRFADVDIVMDVLDNVFLGNALYIVGEEDDFDPDDEVMAILFDIAALYLTDFAVK